MSEISADVLAAVERALKKNPSLTSKELQEQATKVDKSVAELTGRQFHARYALQAKRKLTAPGKKAAKKKRSARKKPAKRVAARKASSRKTTKRKASRKTAPKKVSAKRSQATLRTNDPVRALLRKQFEERRATLDGALDAAFKRAIETDSLAKINELLSSLDQQTSELRSN
jgi:hypothetical protein